MDQEKKNSGKATEKAAADNESVKSAKKPAAKKTTKKAPKLAEKDGFIRVEVGGEMPYYLL